MLIWACLAFLVLVTLVSGLFALRQGLRTWRAFKRLNGAIGEGLDSIGQRTAEIELHLQAAGASGTRLSAALEQLSGSRERLAVLTAALADVRAAVGRVTGVVPSK